MTDVMIADDQELIRESLKVVLAMRPDMHVSAVCQDGEELLQALTKHLPDVILMDVRMPRLDGVEATREVKKRYPKVKVIILTTFDDDEYILNALKYGASGYLLKGASVTDLVGAIRKVAQGSAMLNPEILDKVMRLFQTMACSRPFENKLDGEGLASLTRSERRVARLVGRGMSNREIAGELSLSEGTVRNALSAALAKLSLRDRTQLAIWAVETGLAASEEPQA